MSTTIEGVEVEFGRLESDWRKSSILVYVHSRKKPNVLSRAEIDPMICGTANATCMAISAAAGAGVEFLGKRYGDNLDATVAARLALRAFMEECKLLIEIQKDAPAKLQRLEGNLSLLKENERELLSRIKFFLTRGDKLTPGEIKAMDAMIARLHEAQL